MHRACTKTLYTQLYTHVCIQRRFSCACRSTGACWKAGGGAFRLHENIERPLVYTTLCTQPCVHNPRAGCGRSEESSMHTRTCTPHQFLEQLPCARVVYTTLCTHCVHAGVVHNRNKMLYKDRARTPANILIYWNVLLPAFDRPAPSGPFCSTKLW